MISSEHSTNPGHIPGIAVHTDTTAVERAAQALGLELDVTYRGLRAIATDPSQALDVRRAAIVSEDALLVRLGRQLSSLERAI